MAYYTVGVFGSSAKKDEKRVPIHPEQLQWIDQDVRELLYFEEGYGERFGFKDVEIGELVAGVLPRSELFAQCDIALLPKPLVSDLKQMRPGSILWGWPHCVQQNEITQVAIDSRLTLLAWEAMHKWSRHGDWQMHIFHKNNEIAGYAAVLHAMNIAGIDGNYGPQRKAVVMSFGSVSRGAIRALQARGVNDITVFTQRHYILVADQMAGINYYQFDTDDNGLLVSIRPDQSSYPMIEELADADIIVNGILQDTDQPIMFVNDGEQSRLKRGCLIVDVSCDEGMGFPFAKPTTFSSPMLEIDQLHYYAVDHTPSYLWNAASWEISNSLLPYLPLVVEGPDRWSDNETLRRAIEIRDGEILNPKITSFQQRETEYPHRVLQGVHES